jgi:hypothetical protein
MNWATIAILFFFGVNLGLVMAWHGKKSKHNAWAALVATIIECVLIYYSGGFQ